MGSKGDFETLGEGAASQRGFRVFGEAVGVQGSNRSMKGFVGPLGIRGHPKGEQDFGRGCGEPERGSRSWGAPRGHRARLAQGGGG